MASFDEDIVILNDDETPTPVKRARLDGTASPVNGVSGGPKRTARKSMSSFTPRVTVPEVVELDADDDADETPGGRSNGYAGAANPKAGALRREVDSFLQAVRGNITAVELDKTRAKLDKRCARVLALTSFCPLDGLAEFLRRKRQLTLERPLDTWICVKAVLDEFDKYKAKRAAPDARPSQSVSAVGGKGEGGGVATGSVVGGDDPGLDRKHRLHLKKLYRARDECAATIRRAEEAEMSLDDLNDENSDYIRVSRYKRRYVQIRAKIHELLRMKKGLGRKADKKFKTEASRVPEVNEAIMRMVNAEKRFPDFADVLRAVTDADGGKNLGHTKQELLAQAKDTFVTIGKELKRRRVFDDDEVLDSYLPENDDADDPAENDEDLARVLDTNAKESAEKMHSVIDEFARKQEERNEEAKEVSDNAAESSPEDDDENDDDDGEGDDDDDGKS